MAGTQTREQELAEWTAGIVGRPSVELHRQPGGGRHEAWSITDAHGGRWFLRTDRYSPGAHEHYTLRREAGFYRAAGAAGIPVPAVLAVHPPSRPCSSNTPTESQPLAVSTSPPGTE